MIVQRIHHEQILTNDPAVIYTENPIDTYKRILEDRYVGVVFKRCFVQSITDILVGRVISDSERVGGYFKITVLCIIHGVSYDRYETIHGCVVSQIVSDNLAILNTDHCAIGLQINSKLQFLKVGDIIPVTCVESSYTPRKTEIIVSAVPKTKLTHLVNLSNIVRIPDKESVQILLDEINKLSKQIKALDQKKASNAIKWLSTDTLKKSTSLIDLINTRSGDVMKLSREGIEYGSTNVVITESKEELKNDEVSMVTSILNTIIKEQTDIIGCVKYVSDSPLKKKIILMYNDK